MTDTATKINIFIAYAREDAAYLKELRKQLRILERSKQVDKIWYDGEIVAGQEWEKEIKNAMEVADIFLLLLSADFINSDYCYGVEMEEALARHEAGTSTIIPIVLRDCAWHYTPLSKIQAPVNGQAIAGHVNKDKLYTGIVEAIVEVIQNRHHVIRQPLISKISLPKSGMVFVKGGTFQMGYLNYRDGGFDCTAKPIHEVIVKDFYISKYVVINEDYCTFLNSKGNQEISKLKDFIENGDNKIKLILGKFIVKNGYERHPVTNISYYAAFAYANWLSNITQLNFRLPSEAQWEYAARGGQKSKGYQYSGSNDFNEVAWCLDNSVKSRYEVGKKEPNELSLYDMSGNVWEWCEDVWHNNYESTLLDGSACIEGNDKFRVIRGGSCRDISSYCRICERALGLAYERNINCGFRLVIT